MEKNRLFSIIKFMLVVTMMCTMITGCGSNQTVPVEKNIADDVVTEPETDESQTVDTRPYAEYSNSILFSMVTPAWYNAERNNMIIHEFDERDEIFNLYTQDNWETIQTEAFYVTEKQHYFDWGYGDSHSQPPYELQAKNVPPITNYVPEYKKAASETDYLYYGEFDENSMPTGLGILFVLEEHDDLEDPVYMVKYVGYFKDGLYDGYGIEFESAFLDYTVNIENYYYNWPLYNGDEYYEGYFEQGVHVLKGNYFNSYYEFDLMALENQSDIIAPYNMVYDITTGEYDESTGKRFCRYYCLDYLYYEGEVSEDDEFDGYGKQYVPYTNILYYEGDFVKNQRTGKGKLYSEETGNLIYEGELVNGSYHGEGILYDESGRLIHEGMFAYGDIA